MEKTLRELYREQYECYIKLSQEEIESLYESEGIEENSIDVQLSNIKAEIEKKRNELPSAEDRLLRSIFGEDLRVQKELEEIKKLEQQCRELEKTYKSLSLQMDFNLDIEEMLNVIKQEIIDKRKIMEENNYQNVHKKEAAIKEEIKELEKKYEEMRTQYNNFYKQFHKVVRGLLPNARKFPSRELRNKIVEGTLGIAKYWASIYYRKSENTQSFDELHQIANQALISAAHYYIPSSRAKFSTYARKCIENQLKKAVYESKKMKKRPYNAQDFFQKEKDLIDYVKWFLEATSSVPDNRILDWYPGILRQFRNNIREFNRHLRLFGDNKRSFQSFSYASTKNKETMEKIINNVITILRNSKLKVLLSEDEMEVTNLYLNYKNNLNSLNELLYYLDFYIKKLDLIEEYFIIEKDLQERNDGVTPTDQDILDEFNRRIRVINQEKYQLKQKGFYKNPPKSYKTPESYYGVYMDEYKVDPFISAEDYECSWNGLISKEKEKDDILAEYDDEGIDAYYCAEAIRGMGLAENDKVILCYTDSEYNKLEDYYLCYDEKMDVSEEFYRVFTKQEALEELNRLQNIYESPENYLASVLKARKDYVNSLIKEANEPIYASNLEHKIIVDKFLDGFKYKRYLKENDILKVKADIELLYGDDLELFILLNGKNKSKGISLSVEEEAFNNLFMRDYYKELEKLSDLEREVLLRYYDVNGYHSMTAKEISSELNITPNRVYKEKAKALKKLRDSEKIQIYYEE